jgi:hypothetical protein
MIDVFNHTDLPVSFSESDAGFDITVGDNSQRLEVVIGAAALTVELAMLDAFFNSLAFKHLPELLRDQILGLFESSRLDDFIFLSGTTIATGNLVVGFGIFGEIEKLTAAFFAG